MRKSVGVVISGGGAKGAYSFGFLKRLITEGVRFDAISGTSVGALNAVILSTSAFDEGTKTWGTLTQDQILPFSLPFGLSRFMFALLFPASCFIRCTSGLDPVPDTFNVLNSVIRSICASSWLAVFLFPLLGSAVEYHDPIFGAAIVIFCGLVAHLLNRLNPGPGDMMESGSVLGILAAMWVFSLPLLVLAVYEEYPHLRWSPTLVGALIPAMVFSYFLLARVFVRRWSALSNRPLKALIERFLRIPLTIPTYV